MTSRRSRSLGPLRLAREMGVGTARTPIRGKDNTVDLRGSICKVVLSVNDGQCRQGV